MGIEIERKFLVFQGMDWKGDARGILCRQGYICNHPAGVVRVRLAGDKAWLTLKGERRGPTALEYEYSIPKEDACSILREFVRGRIIEKYRYCIPYEGLLWEVDEFLGENTGLVLAEVELKREDQPFVAPLWMGVEVTDDPRYSNAYLVENPYLFWREKPGG